MINNYNPDVLTCLANLSNDEVFTPPALANQMLDLLPKTLWSNPKARFLDPVCKSGVFLREIAKRLMTGLETQIPDTQERCNHIFQNQLFGIAITELTALLSRRSVYCTKTANNKYSVCTVFEDEQGNIRHERMQHTWNTSTGSAKGKCVYCGASREVYERDGGLESYAYNFIHPDGLYGVNTKKKNQTKKENMKFDVIIGNPPYQLSDGGGEGASAMPIYHYFILQAIKLNPHYLIMIVPARWYSGGKGLDDFRNQMLNDERIAEIHDFPETDLCFPGLNIRGGVCYFLWDSTHKGNSTIVNHSKTNTPNTSTRPLLENGTETFIRYNRAISILQKVKHKKENTFGNIVYSRNVFDIPSNFERFSKNETQENSILLFRSRRGSTDDKEVFIAKEDIKKNFELVEKIKVLVSKVSPGGDEYPHAILTKPIIARYNSVCTETYLLIRICANEDEANNLVSYLSTRFFRFLVSLIKNTQNISKNCFQLVPLQDFSESWTDSKLYAKYGLTAEEIAFIESMIRPMELGKEERGEE
jgi:site-specific DNA-methyltransferase (adenine-specific)